MSIRAATADDVAAVAGLERDLFGPDAWTPGQVAEELLGDHRAAWSAGDPVVGYVVTRTVGDVSDLQRIGVHPDRRRRGLARDLLAVAAADAAGRGAGRMLLEVSADNPGAVAFYLADGFVEIDRRPRYYRDGSDALVLARPLVDALHLGGAPPGSAQ